jgi:hypothetical protein
MSRVTLAVLSLILTFGSATEVHAQAEWHFRAAWNKRSAEAPSAHYLATGKLAWSTLGASGRVAGAAELRLEAWLDSRERKLRVETSNGRRRGNQYILDGREYHSCLPLPAGSWRVLSARRVAEDADWPLFYPFLLAHGIVPLPPLAVPPTRGELADDALWREQANVRGHETSFSFAGKPALAATIGHDSSGLINRYRATSEGRTLFEITILYRREATAPRLDRFTVVRYGHDGQPSQELDMRVTEFRTDLPIAAELFVPPEGAKLGKELSGTLKQRIDVKLRMSLDDIERELQAAFGRGVMVRIDRAAFAADPRTKTDQLMFEPGKATVLEFLLDDLPRNRLDFYFDQGDLIVIPRSKAWKLAQSVGYAPVDYGLTPDQLRDLIYQTGKHADWSDVGGPATILLDEETDRINVYHTQSDHLRFMQRLSDLSE